MRLEYFQLIDRIIDLNLTDLTIRVEANVPTESTIFEGHFPGRPLMPGVLLIEAMAQAAGWLLIARNRFDKMPFLATVKEAKLRTFVTPGQALTVSAKIMHEGSGFAMTEAEIARARAQLKAGLLMGLESPTGQAERMARSLAIWGRVPDAEEVARRIDAVTAGDVRDHAQRMIARAQPALALYGPVRKAPAREALADHARHHVGDAAGRDRNDQLDRAARIILRRGLCRAERDHESEGSSDQVAHDVLPKNVLAGCSTGAN